MISFFNQSWDVSYGPYIRANIPRTPYKLTADFTQTRISFLIQYRIRTITVVSISQNSPSMAVPL